MKRLLRSRSDFNQTILRNQLTSLVLFEALTLKRAQAKRLESTANVFFNRLKSADLGARKYAHQTLLDKLAVKKVFEELLPRFNKNDTTFVRTISMNPRRGDNAPQTLVALTKQLDANQVEKKNETPTEAKTMSTDAKTQTKKPLAKKVAIK